MNRAHEVLEEIGLAKRKEGELFKAWLEATNVVMQAKACLDKQTHHRESLVRELSELLAEST